jgi:ribonucleoside-diphosphate reductase alpha chain
LVPKEIREVFVVSGDVKVEEHVMMQAAMQAFVDNAISKTINFPATATQEEVQQAYVRGWKMGLKGMTVYVTGSRETVVLETQETKSKKTQATLEPFVVNGNGYVGKTLTKVRPQDAVCPECGTAMVVSEGCVTCPQCAYSKCSV